MVNRVVVGGVAALFAALGCREQQAFVEPEPGLERMLEQPRVDSFSKSAFYANGMGMRHPPVDTVPVEKAIGAPKKIILGAEHGAYVERAPIVVDRALVEQGRAHFEILCATCHGITGDGNSVVADNMDFRKPPSLHEERIRAFPDGRLYHVIRVGYGLMPSYAAELSVEDSWGVVAYVRALELSRHAPVASLSTADRVALDSVGESNGPVP